MAAMTEKSDPFINPVWSALHSTHAHFAMGAGTACKYPADVAPFAAIIVNTPEAMRELHALLAPGERISLVTSARVDEFPPQIDGLVRGEVLPGLQMIAPAGHVPPIADLQSAKVTRLTDADASAMVELTDLAFPGYFRRRTYAMGAYYGVLDGEKLIAMAGERLVFDPCHEISGVCTHPAHTGKGYAAALIAQLMHDHARDGLQSFLHVSSNNHRAIALYERLGFSLLREVVFHRITRSVTPID